MKKIANKKLCLLIINYDILLYFIIFYGNQYILD